MKNPRFEKEDDIGALLLPNPKKIKCTTCMLREQDRPFGDETLNGATLAMCLAYGVKPNKILFDNEDCPYYINEKDDE